MDGGEPKGASSGMPDSASTPGEFLRTVVAPVFGQQVQALRTRIATLERELADRESAEASVRIHIDGDGGGTWYLNVQQGRMELAERPAWPVLFSVAQSTTDWYALARGGAVLGAPAEVPTAGGRSTLTRSRIALLRVVAGTLRLVVRDDDGVERAVTLHFGSGEPVDPPRTTISLRESDARRLRDGSLDPQAAFLQGLVAISGDMALAIQLGTALFL